LSSGELRKQGVRVKLQDQPFQALVALIEPPGEALTREELQKRLWPADKRSISTGASTKPLPGCVTPWETTPTIPASSKLYRREAIDS
jgi:DNA-binding winged helix-turn-helix (wHTH) protein